MRVCAYCQEQKQLSREHVFPESLITLFPEAEYVYFGEEKVIPLSTDNHVVRDVCVTCNNDRLSKLDTVGSGFIKEYFLSDLNPNQELHVSYDYFSLAKWVMKIIYNSTRQYKKSAHPWFEKNSKYMVGLKSEFTSEFSLFLGFFVDLVPLAGMFPDKPFEVIMNPRLITSAFLQPPLKMYNLSNEVSYLLRVGNALFLFIIWNDQISVEDKVKFETEIENKFPYTALSHKSKEAIIYRATDCINSGNLFMVHSRARQRAADMYQMNGFHSRV
ncbi:hypothetical protein C0966_17495 (plasmid) [Bacillus methanolicus]|uniref:hypothetical protein n=1 Tax=Bacillus methanolicus TaxID=1471 RepID=UPI00238043E5|nr:hypothetical protein [Bacillus methanolicus]MDE3841059.1 hypothetical protein [Bacillus methanolicus]